MPGPYDIYGDYQSERTVSSALPFGLGGTGVMGWAPELALWGVGSLTYRYGIKTGLSATANAAEKGALRYSAFQKEVAERVGKAGAAGGRPGVARGRMAKELYRAQVTETTKRVARTRTVPGKNAPVTSRLPSHYANVKVPKRTARGYKFRDKGGKFYEKNKTNVAKARRVMKVATKGARFAEIGQSLKGWGVAIGSAQLAAFAMDIGASIGHAAIDWRPRRDSQTQYEFGGNYTEIGGAYTQRQRAIMAIHDSQLTSRAAIGGEAAFMHM